MSYKNLVTLCLVISLACLLLLAVMFDGERSERIAAEKMRDHYRKAFIDESAMNEYLIEHAPNCVVKLEEF